MQKSINRHIICLTSIFILGNTAIILPWLQSERGSIPAFLISLGFAFLPILILNPFVRRYLGEDSFKAARGAHKAALAAAYCLVAAIALVFAYLCVADWVHFVKQEVLLNTSDIIIVITFVLVALALSFSGIQAVLKLSLIILPLFLILAVVLFCMSLPQMDIARLAPQGMETEKLLPAALKGYLTAFAPALVLMLLVGGDRTNNGKKGLLLGTLFGGLILAVSISHVMLIFGGEYAALLSRPYLYAVSTVSAGELFFRMDGFTYVIYFFTCLIKSAASICAVRLAMSRMFGRFERRAAVLCCIGIAVVYFFLR